LAPEVASASPSPGVSTSATPTTPTVRTGTFARRRAVV
jgi:hypothetical protein